jgi:hypothetical protein
MEGWSQLLFDRVCQDPPSGYKHISIEQILVADRKLWVKISEETRSLVTSTTNGRKNVDLADLAIEKFSHHPDVQFHMLPLPASQSSSAANNQRFQPYPAPKAQAPNKGKGGSKSDAKGAPGKGKIQVPDGCTVKYGEGNNKPICMKYNVGACRANVKPGKRCMHGYHVCWKLDASATLHTTNAPMWGVPDLRIQQLVSQAPQAILWNSFWAQQGFPSKQGELVSMSLLWTMIETGIVPKLHKFH